MNKEELKKIIATNITRLENQKSEDLIKQYENKYNQFQNIPELKKEFKILKQEIIQRKEKLHQAEKTIKNYNCNHEIRLEYTGNGWIKTTYKCIFCGKYINEINTPFISLIAQEQYDNYIENGYTEEIIYKIIEFITEHSSTNDIDIIKEFKNLQLENCEIFYPKNKIKKRK